MKFKGVENWKDFGLGGLCSASPCSGEIWSWDVNSVQGLPDCFLLWFQFDEFEDLSRDGSKACIPSQPFTEPGLFLTSIDFLKLLIVV